MRDDLQAALARIAVLERQLQQAEHAHGASAEEIGRLREQIREQQAEHARERWAAFRSELLRWGRWVGVVAILVAISAAVYFFGSIGDGDERTMGVAELTQGCQKDRAGSCFYLGRQLERVNDPRRALEAYAKSCRLGAGGPACFNEGVLRLRGGDLRGAEAPLRIACTQHQHAAACGNYAHCLLERGAYPEAEHAARRACPHVARRRAPAVNACNNLALALWRQRRMPEAAAEARRSCEAGLDLGCATWAQTALLQRRGDDARRAINLGLRINTRRGGLLRMQGHVVLLVSGSLEEALRRYREAIQLDARDPTEKGQRVRELRGRPTLEVVRDELAELSPHYPERAALVEQVLRALASR